MAPTRIKFNNVKHKTGLPSNPDEPGNSFLVRKRKTKIGGYWLPPANRNKGFATSGQFNFRPSTTINSDLDDMIALGAGWVRLSISWDQIQSAGPGSFDWARSDYPVTQAVNRGLRVLACILFTPNWASTNPSNPYYTDPPDPAKYGTFCAQAVTHYRALGVRHYEIWNEPNIPFWNPVNVAQYTEALKDAYVKMKNVDPYCTVLVGGLSPAPDDAYNINPRTFLSGIYSNGGKGFFDAVGMHPYTQPALPGEAQDWNSWYHMTQMRTTMVSQGDSAKRVWITESGAPTNGSNPSTFVTEEKQSEIIGKGLEVWNTYSWGGNNKEGAPIITYSNRDEGTSTSTEQNFFGVRKYDRTPKPSAQSFQADAYVTSPQTLPPSGMSLAWEGNTVSAWDDVLIENSPGASITDELGGYIRFWMPGPKGDVSDRVEVQCLGSVPIPSAGTIAYYEWEFYIPSGIVIEVNKHDHCTMNQFHGNNQAGYTGGLSATSTDGLAMSIQGGYRYNANDYESEISLSCGSFQRNKWHKFGYHVKWDQTYVANNPTGWAKCYLDGSLVNQVANVPTMGYNLTNGIQSDDKVMFRLGWYPSTVSSTGLDLRVRNVKIYL